MRVGAEAATTLWPLEIGELLDESFDLYRRNFRLFFGISVLLYAPLGLLFVVAGESTEWTAVVNLLGWLAWLVTSGALGFAAIDRIHGRSIMIAAAYRHGLGRLLRLLLAAVVGALAVMAGTLLLIVPGIIVGLWMQLLIPIVVVENRGGVGALERARLLARGHLWRLFLILMGLLLVVLVFNLAVLALAGLVFGVFGLETEDQGQPYTTVEIITGAVVVLVYALFQGAWAPLLTLTQTLAYVDLRVRKEAYDLEVLTAGVEARAVAGRAAAPSPGPAQPPPPGPAGVMEPAT